MSNEPIGEVALVTAFVGAVIALLVAFGVDITQNQITAILGVIIALGPLVVWYQARKSTVPVDKANKAIEQAAALPSTTKTDKLLFEKGS